MATANDIVEDGVICNISRLVSMLTRLGMAGVDVWRDPELCELMDQTEEVCLGPLDEDGESRRTVFEHHIVSNWLADRLEEEGETVVRDVAGLTIWGRITTGQSIALDGVMEAIARKITKR